MNAAREQTERRKVPELREGPGSPRDQGCRTRGLLRVTAGKGAVTNGIGGVVI